MHFRFYFLHILEPISFPWQVRVFYAVRLFLGLLSVITETVLVVALSRKYGKRLACYTLAMLCLTSGCFFASTSGWTFLSVSIVSHIVLLSCVFSDALHFCIWSSINDLEFQLLHYTLFLYFIVLTLFARFLAKFIRYVCHLSFIGVISSRETCNGSCSCSYWCNPWLAILNPGFPASHILLFG